jgi:hypothetical protein
MTRIIAFLGPKQSGKTTAAKYVAGNYGYTRHRFGGPIKAMLKAGFGLSDEQLEGGLKEEPTELLCGKSSREGQTALGDWGRALHPNLWVNRWLNTMPEGKVVCDDVRMPHEFEALKELEAAFVRITRPGHEHSDDHETEAHRLPHTIEILNDGTLQMFLAKVDALVGPFSR